MAKHSYYYAILKDGTVVGMGESYTEAVYRAMANGYYHFHVEVKWA